MATGDVFVNMYTGIGTGSMDIRPASGVTVMITFIGTDGTSYGPLLGGRNSTGYNPNRQWVLTQNDSRLHTLQNCKIFINNSEYIHAKGAHSHNYVSYSGVEI